MILSEAIAEAQRDGLVGVQRSAVHGAGYVIAYGYLWTRDGDEVLRRAALTLEEHTADDWDTADRI